jgi:hypothetical protein
MLRLLPLVEAVCHSIINNGKNGNKASLDTGTAFFTIRPKQMRWLHIQHEASFALSPAFWWLLALHKIIARYEKRIDPVASRGTLVAGRAAHALSRRIMSCSKSIMGRAEARQRLISGASSFTIMQKPTLVFYPITPMAADESWAPPRLTRKQLFVTTLEPQKRR